MKLSANVKLNLRFLFVAAIAAYMGVIGGMVWQMERTQAQKRPHLTANQWAQQLEEAYNAGYAWGHAECNGEEDQ